jgi:hypothetical protein
VTTTSSLETSIVQLTEAIIARTAGISLPDVDENFVAEAIVVLKADLPPSECSVVWSAPAAHRTTIERLIRTRAFQAAFRRKLLAACGHATRQRTLRVFLSYRRAETRDLVRHIAASLRQVGGISVFVDEANLGMGPFPEQLGAHIRSCDVFVLVITSATFDRMDDPGDWVRREIETAFDAEKCIILLRIDNAAIPDSMLFSKALKPLVSFNALDFYPTQFEASLERLCSWLKQ